MSTLIFNYFADNYILLLMLIALWVVLIPNTPTAKADSRMLIEMSILCLILSISTYVDISFAKLPYPTQERLIATLVGYVLRPLIIMIPVGRFAKRGPTYVALWGLFFLNAIVYISALFKPITYSFSTDNQFVRGPLGFTVHVVSVIMMVALIQAILERMHGFEARKNAGVIIVVFIVAATAVGIFIETISDKHCLVETTAICSLAYYMYIHIIYANKAMNDQKERLRDQRNALMISQIKPHFIYNVLNIIYYLCRTNPKLAGETVVKFSDYLRHNLDSSNRVDQLISVKTELNHAQIYADLEMLRFDNISVEYEIEDEAFDVPALTIQPIVENAIRHGVRDKEDGLVIVSTYETDTDHVIIVEDNGIGKIEQREQLGEHEHIGIANVRERVEQMCGGTFIIKMVPDEGTTVTITIPKESR